MKQLSTITSPSSGKILYNGKDIETLDNKYSHIDELLIKRVIKNLLYNAIVHNNENVNIEVNIDIDDKIHIFNRR